MALDYTHKLSSDVGEKIISKIKMIVTYNGVGLGST